MESLPSVFLKLVATPMLIAVASLAGRRWGPAVGGWLVGIPFTSGPIALFLALDHGASFGAAAAAGILAGTASQAAFCLAYAWVAKARGSNPSWVLPLGAASSAFLVTTAILKVVVLPLAVTFAVVLGALVLALRLMPVPKPLPPGTLTFPAWDLPLRMVVATAFVLTLTSVAPSLGPRLAGLLAPYPIYATVLTVFAHRIQGPASAAEVLRGLLLGLFAFASFFFAVSALLTDHGLFVAFGAALVAGLAVQISTLAFRRPPAA